MNVKMRSGLATLLLKTSLIVMRPYCPAVKFGSTVIRSVSPALSGFPSLLNKLQGMRSSWT